MTIAILGGTGFIGRQVIKRLRDHGETVLLLHRGNNVPDPLPAGVTARQVDRNDAPALAALFRQFSVTAAIDVIALTLAQTAGVREAAALSGVRYVMVSGGDVYASFGAMIGRDSAEPNAPALREDAPLRTSRFPLRGSTRLPKGIDPELLENYDKIVIEEAAFADKRLETTVLRPGMTFGPGDRQHRFGWVVGAARAGSRVAVDARAMGWKSSYGFVTDVADAIALAALEPKAAGRIYNIAQPEARSVAEWIRTFADAVGTKVEIVPVGPEAGGLLADRAGASDLRYHLALDSTRIRDELGFVELVSEAEALMQTIAYETPA